MQYFYSTPIRNISSVPEFKTEDTMAITKVEADLEDLEPLRMRRRKRRKRKTIDDLEEFVAGEDFFHRLEDIDHEEICEPKVGRKKKGRSMSAEEAQPELAAEKQCVDCGVVLAYATKKDKQRFRDHMVVHERERFTCDCDCEFADRCVIELRTLKCAFDEQY